MTTYLSRLVDRTLGRAPVVQPIIAPRFGGGPDFAAEPWSTEVETTAPPPRPAGAEAREGSVAPAVPAPQSPPAVANATAPVTLREVLIEKTARVEAGAAPAGEQPPRLAARGPGAPAEAEAPAPPHAAAPSVAPSDGPVRQPEHAPPVDPPPRLVSSIPGSAVAAPTPPRAADAFVAGADAPRVVDEAPHAVDEAPRAVDEAPRAVDEAPHAHDAPRAHDAPHAVDEAPRARNERIDRPEPRLPAANRTARESLESPARPAISLEAAPPVLVVRRVTETSVVHPAAASSAPQREGRAAPVLVDVVHPAAASSAPQRDERAAPAPAESPVVHLATSSAPQRDERAARAPSETAPPQPLAPRLASPGRSPMPAAPRAPAASSPPVIRVHVGRVDVRAVHAPPPPAPAPKSNRISLADYLEKQGRS